nr:RsiV family protein [Hyunsoonleella aquatilis]
MNFDATTGKPIQNENLFKNIDGFKALAKSYFNKAVEDRSVLFEPDSFSLPANMGYTEEGIILLYNPYEIAPYAKGIIDFTIPFENAEGYLAFQGL